ncbi:MAG: PaaX family transcriptional regulator [Solirubrobacteraceae bacterium]
MRSQDLVITVLGSHLRRPAERVWSGGMVQAIKEFGFSTEAVRAALSRLVSRGLLERHRSGRLIDYALTTRAHELLAEGDRRIFTFGRTAPAADAWTLLWHTIPEDRRVERSRLASQLRFLGFGSLQDATWIAASDREQEVRGLLASLGVEDYASIFLGRMARGSEAALLISEAWDLEALSRRYEQFLADYGPYERQSKRRGLSDRDAFVVRSRLMHAFISFSLMDPELPESIAPTLGRRDKVVATFDSVYESLAPAAEAYFESVAVVTGLPREQPVGAR